MKSRLLDQFYTKEMVAKKCFDFVLDFLNTTQKSFDVFLEPSAGLGSFWNLFPIDKRVGFDLDPKCDDIIVGDFLEQNLTQECVTIGNPPFGKNSSLAIKFFNHAATFSSVVAFIVPKTFQKNSIQNRLHPNFHLVKEFVLDKNSFTFDGVDYDVPCVFQVWERKSNKRLIAKQCFTHDDFVFTSKSDAAFAIQRVGVNAGRVKVDFKSASPNSNYFIKSSLVNFNKDLLSIFLSVVWDEVKFKTAGNPSISKQELIFLYNKYKNILS